MVLSDYAVGHSEHPFVRHYFFPHEFYPPLSSSQVFPYPWSSCPKDTCSFPALFSCCGGRPRCFFQQLVPDTRHPWYYDLVVKQPTVSVPRFIQRPVQGPGHPRTVLRVSIQKLSVSFNDQDQAPDDPHFVQNSQCSLCDLYFSSLPIIHEMSQSSVSHSDRVSRIHTLDPRTHKQNT